MFPISISSSTTNRRAFPISSLQSCVRRSQVASIPRITAHCFNMFWRNFSLERTEPAQAKSMFPSHTANLFYTFSRQMFTQRVILEAPFQGQGNCFRHAGICLTWRETKVKVEIYGAWNIDHSSVNY